MFEVMELSGVEERRLEERRGEREERRGGGSRGKERVAGFLGKGWEGDGMELRKGKNGEW